jgi:hypothetical protein
MSPASSATLCCDSRIRQHQSAGHGNVDRAIDERVTPGHEDALMHPQGFRVVVVRAWRDAGGVRIRLLATGESRRQWVVMSIPDACEVLESVLSGLLEAPATADGSGTSDTESARRPLNDEGPSGSRDQPF